MQLAHRPASGGDGQVLAAGTEFADSLFSKTRGLMFRQSMADGSALVFRFDSETKRSVHMLFVPFAIDALWVADNEVQATKRLRPWIGFGRGTADTLIELPAGAAEDVSVGDRVVLNS